MASIRLFRIHGESRGTGWFETGVCRSVKKMDSVKLFQSTRNFNTVLDKSLEVFISF